MTLQNTFVKRMIIDQSHFVNHVEKTSFENQCNLFTILSIYAYNMELWTKGNWKEEYHNEKYSNTWWHNNTSNNYNNITVFENYLKKVSFSNIFSFQN